MHQPDKKITLLAAAITAIFGLSSAHAAGFRLPEVSVVGVGTSNALVANTDELGALPYNPANMAFHDKNGLVAGVTYIGYDLKVDTTVQGGQSTDSIGTDSFWVPNLYAMAPGYGKWSFGLGINAPFGLETGWPINTFPNFIVTAPTDLGFAPEVSSIEMINVNPNVAYKINDTTSLAIGIDFYDVRDLALNTHGAKITGSGYDFGWNLGFTKQLGNWNLGFSYRSKVNVNVSGSAVITGLGALAARSAVEFPDMLQAGAYWQATDKFGLELDVEYTAWSNFDELKITDASGNLISLGTNNWEDTFAIRLGAIVALTPTTKLLLGYSYDETAQPDAHFSARVPDSERQLFSIGVTHDFASWTLEASYMYVPFDDRTINRPAGSYAVAGQDPNGTDAFNGTYEASVNLLSVGLSTKF